MNDRSFYRRILRSWHRFQFEISVFGLGVLGVWLAWKLSQRPFVPDWVIYLIVMWAIVLVLHLLRIIYLIKKNNGKK
jgi:hypothetical protein